MTLLVDKSKWTRVRLGDVVRRSRKQVDPLQARIGRYVAGGHIDGESITIDRWGDPSDGQMGSTFRYVFEPGQVLFVSARPYLRKSGVANFTGVVADKTYVLDAISERGLLQEFLPFILASDSFVAYANVEATGSMNPRLLWGPLQRYEFDLPPVGDQKRISELLLAAESHRRSLGVLNRALVSSNHAAFTSLLAEVKTQQRTLGSIGRFTRGRRFTKADYVDAGLGCIHYAQIHTDFGTTASEPVTFLPESMRSSLRLAHHGDLVIAGTSEDVGGVGKAVAWLGDDDVAVHDDCFVFTHGLDPHFASLLFASAEFDRAKRTFVSETKVVRLSAASLEAISLPVPDLADQHSIVVSMRKISRGEELVATETTDTTAVLRALSTAVFGSN